MGSERTISISCSPEFKKVFEAFRIKRDMTKSEAGRYLLRIGLKFAEQEEDKKK